MRRELEDGRELVLKWFYDETPTLFESQLGGIDVVKVEFITKEEAVDEKTGAASLNWEDVLFLFGDSLPLASGIVLKTDNKIHYVEETTISDTTFNLGHGISINEETREITGVSDSSKVNLYFPVYFGKLQFNQWLGRDIQWIKKELHSRLQE